MSGELQPPVELPRPSVVMGGNVLLLVLAVAGFMGIRQIGDVLPSAGPSSPAGPSAVRSTETVSVSPHILPRVLTALVVVIITSRILGTLFQYIGQPRVIGEVVAGILLGPSLLGRISPDGMDLLFPTRIMPFLSVLAQLGVILYMFLVGLELNSELLRSRAAATLAISNASIIAPFLLGAILALWLFPGFAPAGVPFSSFAMFLGLAMAITAFPVLARILSDRNMVNSELGAMALSCAAAGDVTAWCLLALIVGAANADLTVALRTVVLTLCYMAMMFVIVRPVLTRRFSDSSGARVTSGVTAWVLVAVLVSSLITEAIGIHALFGAFLLGAVIPHDSQAARHFQQKLEDVVSILLLPAFFAWAGLRTEIGLLSQPSDWLFCLVIILVATLGKFGGTLAAARLTGFGWRTSASLGILMNTRGLMELIVLNIGLDLGVISPVLFAMMVLMALVTTVITTPILRWLHPAA